MSDFTKALIQLRGKQVFLKTDPEILDFTNSGQKKNLIIQCENATITIPLPFRSEELARAIAPLTGCIGEDANIIIGWNIKSFFSYCLISGWKNRAFQSEWCQSGNFFFNKLQTTRIKIAVYFTNFDIVLNSEAADERVSSNKMDSAEVIMIPS